MKEITRRDVIKTFSSIGLLSGLTNIAQGQLSSEITHFSASELSIMIRSQKVSCEEVMRAYLTKIAKYNPIYNAIVSIPDEDLLIGQAKAADIELSKGSYRGWMHGMPHAIKDLAYSTDLPTSEGSPIFAGTYASADDLFVSRLRAAGAIFVGKTNVPEFGYGSQTYNPVFGPTRNAYIPSLTAGGSSGGAAVGLATQMLPVADGSDMMGSLRNPAAYNNVIGFRPSQGRVPSYYVNSDSFYQQLSTDGAMGRNVEDMMRLLFIMSGPDNRVPLSLKDPLPNYDDLKAPNLRDLKIGWMGDYNGYLPTEKGVLQLCETALNDLEDEGLRTEFCMPKFEMQRLWQAWLTLRHWSCLWAKKYYDDPNTRKLLKPELIWEVEGAFNINGHQLHEAGKIRTSWYESLLALFNNYDFLALPSAQIFPFSIDSHWPKSINGVKMDTYHRWMEVVIGGTLAGLPVINLPVGFDAQGRPMGIQFMGRMGEDAKLIEFAMAYEASTDHLNRRPNLQRSL